MKLVKGRPPIYDEIVRVLGRPPASAGFTWGELLYVQEAPFGYEVELDPALLAHETLHAQQQFAAGGPLKWWTRYLAEPEFRLQEELAAYRLQYAHACADGLSRQARRAFARKLASDLASQLYGRVIKREAAYAAIVG